MGTQFYIPKNVTLRYEVVNGIGIKEIIYIGIAAIIGVIIAYFINAITGNFLVASLAVAILAGGTFILNIKDKNNQSILMIIKDIIKFYSAQKYYEYVREDKAYGVLDEIYNK